MNDERSLRSWVVERNSAKAAALSEPGPNINLLEQAAKISLNVPDHGAIRPVRYVVLQGADRQALGRALVVAARNQGKDLDQEAEDNLMSKPLRAPTLVAVVVRITPDHPKVPAIEQITTAAMSAYVLMDVLRADGFGSVLLSGLPAHDPSIIAFLGFQPHDRLIGFIYTGTEREPKPIIRRSFPSDLLRPRL